MKEEEEDVMRSRGLRRCWWEVIKAMGSTVQGGGEDEAEDEEVINRSS